MKYIIIYLPTAEQVKYTTFFTNKKYAHDFIAYNTFIKHNYNNPNLGLLMYDVLVGPNKHNHESDVVPKYLLEVVEAV
jgi:hypothetical protein